jgi:hypothetical protein
MRQGRKLRKRDFGREAAPVDGVAWQHDRQLYGELDVLQDGEEPKPLTTQLLNGFVGFFAATF